MIAKLWGAWGVGAGISCAFLGFHKIVGYVGVVGLR